MVVISPSFFSYLSSHTMILHLASIIFKVLNKPQAGNPSAAGQIYGYKEFLQYLRKKYSLIPGIYPYLSSFSIFFKYTRAFKLIIPQ